MQLLSWLCLLSFLQLPQNFSNSLVMLLLFARLVWALLGMHSVFLLLPLISRTSLLFGFDLGRVTESETLLPVWNLIKKTFHQRCHHEGEQEVVLLQSKEHFLLAMLVN